MRTTSLICILVSGSILSWSIVCADFYVIPTARKNFAPVVKTGQTICYNVDGTVRNCANTGQDGEYHKGVDFPVPRFRDNGDGTVTDNLTQLIWLKNADCFGQRTWAEALSNANGLADGQCGLSDGSFAGDWHLPNARELQSLIHFGYSNPALPDTAGTSQWADGDPFFNVRSDFYWSSTTVSGYSDNAWIVLFAIGGVGGILKGGDGYVWCVRGGP